MNGAKAEPSVRTMRAPSNTRKTMIGASHHFLRALRKSQNSRTIESFDIIYPLLSRYVLIQEFSVGYTF